MKKISKQILVLLLVTMISFSPNFSTIISSANSTYQVGDIIEFGSYPQQKNGSVFVVEPIKWIVIETKNDMLYLLSEKILDYQQYNTKDVDVTWETCSLRKWLNEDFYNYAFTEFEKTQICTSKLRQSINNRFGGTGGNDTYDKVFAPSTSEIAASSAQKYRIAKVTEYFISKSGTFGYDKVTLEGTYFTRVHGCDYDYYTYIDDDGGIGWYGNRVTYKCGVRPAIKLNTNFQVQSKYNPETDKYSFGNYSAKIPESYYQNLFGKIKGSAIYSVKKDCSTRGVCYGMALSTSAILQNTPPVSWLDADYLSEVGKYSFNDFMTTDNFIRYAYIYQFGAKNTLNEWNFIDRGIKVVGQQVSSALGSNKYILITFDGGNKNCKHAVLAVDKVGEDIYVNDSNEWNKLCMINVEGDYWEYSAGGFSWNSNNAKIWTTDLTDEFVKGMQEAGLYKLTDDLGDELTYLESAYNLAVVSNNATFENNDQFYLVSSYASGVEPTENTSNNQLYWTESNSLSVTGISQDNTDISLVNTDTAVKTNLSKDSEATITLYALSSDINILSKENNTYDVQISTTSKNNEIIEITVGGIANGEEIAVSKTDNSIEVSGLNDVNATLKVDENTEKKTTFNVDNGDKLTLDFDNENNEIKTDKEFLITVSENNSYRVGDIANIDVTVIGSPTKIRFVDNQNNVTSYTPESKSVNSITDNGDGTVTWNIDITTQTENDTYAVYAKFAESGWNSESGIITLKSQPFDNSYHSTEFDTISDGVIYSGINTITVKTGADVTKVQLYKNGNTWTYNEDNATFFDENGIRTWTIKMNFSELGDHTYYVRTRSRKTAFEVVDILNLTVYSK